MSDDERIIEGREIADLLPFYATGTLRGREKMRVAVALAADPALQRELGLILEERQATIEANESLGAPSRAASDRFFAMLDTQAPKASRPRFDIAAWIAAQLEGLRPRTLAWATVAALAIVVVQAGGIGLMLTHGAPSKAGFETASVALRPVFGAMVIVGFVPDATASDIATLLVDTKATIVAGPTPGGLYQIRIGDHTAGAAETDAIVAKLKAASKVIRFAAPAGTGAD